MAKFGRTKVSVLVCLLFFVVATKSLPLSTGTPQPTPAPSGTPENGTASTSAPPNATQTSSNASTTPFPVPTQDNGTTFQYPSTHQSSSSVSPSVTSGKPEVTSQSSTTEASTDQPTTFTVSPTTSTNSPTVGSNTTAQVSQSTATSTPVPATTLATKPPTKPTKLPEVTTAKPETTTKPTKLPEVTTAKPETTTKPTTWLSSTVHAATSTVASTVGVTSSVVKEPVATILRETDVDADGFITKAELTGFRARFDVNGDGLVEEIEFATKWNDFAQGFNSYGKKAVFQFLDEDGDGSLGFEDVNRLFFDFDKSGDNAVNSNEFIAGWEEILENGRIFTLFLTSDKDGDGQVDKAEADIIFTDMANGDGVIHETEWVSYMADRGVLVDAPLARLAFDLSDKDQDNFINKDSDYADIFSNFDDNGNGFITKKEYVRHFTQTLEKLRSDPDILTASWLNFRT